MFSFKNDKVTLNLIQGLSFQYNSTEMLKQSRMLSGQHDETISIGIGTI